MTERQDVQLLDVNVLVALVSPQHVHHAAAHRWFAQMSDWATTPIIETAFVRLISNPVVAGTDFTHRFLRDEARLLDPSIDLAALIGPRQVTDFHLVQLAKVAGATLATFDAKLVAALADADRRHVHLIEL
jgi:uncharacterized protein